MCKSTHLNSRKIAAADEMRSAVFLLSTLPLIWDNPMSKVNIGILTVLNLPWNSTVSLMPILYSFHPFWNAPVKIMLNSQVCVFRIHVIPKKQLLRTYLYFLTLVFLMYWVCSQASLSRKIGTKETSILYFILYRTNMGSSYILKFTRCENKSLFWCRFCRQRLLPLHWKLCLVSEICFPSLVAINSELTRALISLYLFHFVLF